MYLAKSAALPTYSIYLLPQAEKEESMETEKRMRTGLPRTTLVLYKSKNGNSPSSSFASLPHRPSPNIEPKKGRNKKSFAVLSPIHSISQEPSVLDEYSV